MRDYIHVTHIPPGLAMQHRHNAPQGWKQAIGKGQSTQQPHRNTTVRPITVTTFDENDEVVSAADEWIIAGDWSDETWLNDDDRTAAVAQVMCDYLGIPEQQQPAIKATMQATLLTHDEVLTLAAQWDSQIIL
jgi:hypothetical protein